MQNKNDSNEVLKSPLAAEIKEPGRAYPFSYTHLDVYKRQGLPYFPCGMLVCGRQGGLYAMFKVKKRKDGQYRNGSRPVSYTHLDVYKRQG